MVLLRLLTCWGLQLTALSALAQTPNALTDSEKAAGWQLMFDGKSLAGWHSFKKTSITDFGWIVKDSAIYLRGPAAGALLAPDAFAYKNFAISIDWKLPDSGNSGIFLRYLETEAVESIRTGPETQICGKMHPDYKNGTSLTSPGACYAMYAPSRPWIKSAEEYNTLQVIMYENKVAHFGNGVKLLEYVIGDSDWTARYEVSKYNNFPLYGDIHAGKLFLQDHASHVWYRNIKILPLDKDPWTDSGIVLPQQGTPIRVPRAQASREFAIRLTGDGRLSLVPGGARDWDLGVFDPLGRVRGVLRGEGPFREEGARSVGPARLPGAIYLLQGKVDGNRTPSSLITSGP